MQSDNIAEIKKEDKQLKKKYIFMMVGLLFGGFLVGFFSALLADVFSGGIENAIVAVRNFFVENASVIGLVMGLLTALVVTFIYVRNRKCYAKWDGEDEDVSEEVV